MTYDEELDEWVCANNKRLTFAYEKKQKTDNGYITKKRTYRCLDCQGCPFHEICAKGKDTKTISVSLENQQQRRYESSHEEEFDFPVPVGLIS
jgi:hypothetical protein